MKVSINSRMRLTPIGWIGAVLFVGAPVFGAWVYMRALEGVARSLRYGLPPGDISSPTWTAVIAGAASLAGLVMVIAGRSYLHEVATTQ